MSNGLNKNKLNALEDGKYDDEPENDMMNVVTNENNKKNNSGAMNVSNIASLGAKNYNYGSQGGRRSTKHKGKGKRKNRRVSRKQKSHRRRRH
jgi:bifunctional ADP-heptose synthase (sugar kinase/adenylyltransferase)